MVCDLHSQVLQGRSGHLFASVVPAVGFFQAVGIQHSRSEDLLFYLWVGLFCHMPDWCFLHHQSLQGGCGGAVQWGIVPHLVLCACPLPLGPNTDSAASVALLSDIWHLSRKDPNLRH